MTFRCHEAVQIDVERCVSDAHRTATQLDRFSISPLYQFIMLKALRCVFRSGPDRILASRRLARLNPASQSVAKYAHRTESHCSRKFIATDRADALGLRAHGANRLSDAIKASQRACISSSISAGSDTVVAFHKEFRVSATIAAKSMFRNKIPETLKPGCFCVALTATSPRSLDTSSFHLSPQFRTVPGARFVIAIT
jgi:hypothetical protein